ncbi:MAG: hypothetical protein RLZZ230_263 [Candidatus Parcubacteria bacterium]|jgi:D-alanyl-D-alanine carboxypeptidase (penicillin-binding protein 5/6)
MNEQYPHLIDTLAPAPKNRFPILAQLGFLALILIGLFSSLIFKDGTKTEVATSVQTTEFSHDNNEYPIAASLQKIEDVKVRAKAAYVWDVRNQRVLFSKDADEPLPLASITKLMTAILTHELVSSKKETAVPVSAVQQEGSSGLASGEHLDIESLLQMALVSSSNDAAYALSASVGTLLGDQDPTAQFVKAMNIRAEELGLKTLEFWNPTGLDLSPTKPGAIGSARDVTFLMEYIVRNYPGLISETQQDEMRVYNADGQYHDIENTNEIALKIPNLIGSKTGYTDLAGGNLTIAFDIGFERPVIITVLGSTREERFSDVLKLIAAVQNSVVEN